MSTLKADTLVAADGTSPVTLTKQSAAKVWHHYNQSGTLATVDSFNVSTATDTQDGVVRTAYTNALANLGYAVSGSHNLPSGNTASWVTGLDNSNDFTTGQVSCSTFNDTNGRVDATKSMMMIQGDLA